MTDNSPALAAKTPSQMQRMVRRRVRRRTIWRRVRLGSMIVGGVLVVGGLAFGIDRMVVSLTHYYGGHNSTASRETTTPGANASTTTSTTPGPPDCDSSGLSAVVYNWQETAGTQYETVLLTNISQATCTLDGYPTLGVTASDGTPLPAPTSDAPTLGSGPDPESGSPSTTAGGAGAPAGEGPAPVPLASRGQAWFELSYPVSCSQILTEGATPGSTPDECYAGATLEVTPPKATGPLLLTQPVRLTYQTSGFMVGPFLPGPPPRFPPVSPTSTTTTA